MDGQPAQQLRQRGPVALAELLPQRTGRYVRAVRAVRLPRGRVRPRVGVGLGTLVGFGGWEAMGQAWKGLAQLATGLVISAVPGAGALFWTLPDDKLPSWLRDSRTAMKETGKALVAWDEWGKNPGRAAGAVTFNVLTTVFTGGAGGAAAGAGKAGAVAKVLSVAGKTGKFIDPMTYIAKGAGSGLSKIGDITKGLKGIENIEIPKLPDGSVQLPDGRLLDPNGNLIAPNGVVDTTPIPHDTVPGTSGLPTSWQIQQPVPTGVHAGNGIPDMPSYPPGGGFDNVSYGPGSHVPGGNHVPGVSSHVPTDHFPTTPGHNLPPNGFHGPGHDLPGTNPHAPDAPHTPHNDGPGTPHNGGHDNPYGGHTDDAAGHTDDAAHTGDPNNPGNHFDPHGTADDIAHGADDGTPPGGHHDPDGSGTGASPDDFTYKPHVSEADFDALSTAEKHRVAAAELTDGTVPFADDFDAVQYGRDYWNDYVDNLDPSAQQALRDYTGDSFPSYKDMNGYLRNDPHYGPRPEVLHDISEMDRVMSTRPVPQDVMVVRGTGIGHLDLDSPLEMMGGTYGDEGYLSTSLGNHPVPSFAGKDAILHLRVPKGTPALWLEKVSHYGVTEREILLGRGSEYRVTRVFVDEAGQAQVYGEILPR
ncbi:ADP-ribosyltransferase [Streptomyces sp. sk2.1]|uniref:ADP-ribosyltransferase n=1 Tax=Streptomyces sp. sk2.1 TaxID=2478959 RepID=UPI0021CC7DC0|nr:ADP-ribosyltransferase [Streptomyces sp. sk2.1]